MRLKLLQRAIVAGVALIWVNLFFLQVIRGHHFKQQSEKNRTRLIHLPAARGSIIDRNGIALAQDIISFELAALPQELKNPSQTWDKLSALVKISPEELQRRYKKGFTAKFAPVALARHLDRSLAFRLEEERDRLPGIMIRPIPQRVYPAGKAVGSVAGYLGLIAPAELTKLKPYGYTFRDRVGKDGLEQLYDSVLRGKDGGLHVEVNAQGKLVQQMGFLQPQRGRRITVSIDSRLQEICYRILDGGTGAILVMDSSNGEMLALASSPSFDPNAFVDQNRSSEISPWLHDSDRPMFNRATRAVVPPGSIFKAMVAYEALQEGKISSGNAFECPGSFRLGRSVFKCWYEQGHKAQTVTEALQHSCNVFFYNTGRRLGHQAIARSARLFHLDKATGIDLPREARGLVPDSEWMFSNYKRKWQEGDTISFAIGQGPLQVTPLQMLVAFNAIGTGGQIFRPKLLREIESSVKAPERPMQPLSLNTRALRTVQQGLEQVVNSESGTGRLARLPDIKVAAKTGTAQNPGGRPHAWFCGYAPSEKPKISFAVFLEHGGKGGFHAAKVAGELLGYLKEMEYL